MRWSLKSKGSLGRRNFSWSFPILRFNGCGPALRRLGKTLRSSPDRTDFGRYIGRLEVRNAGIVEQLEELEIES